MVSRKHAKIVGADGKFIITDLGSTNGTFVNGEKIRRADIMRTDRILIGTSIIKVIAASEMTAGTKDPVELRQAMEEIAESANETATMSGDLEDVPVPDLLQLFATNKKSGILTITGENKGKLYIKEGQLRFAVVGGDNGMPPMKAICRMVGWDRGAFTLDDWDGREDFDVAFEESTESLLMEAMRQHDELRKIGAEMPEPDDVLAWCLPMVPKLSDLDGSHLDALQLVLNFNTYKAIVEKAPGTDFEIISRVHSLLRDGYLETE